MGTLGAGLCCGHGSNGLILWLGRVSVKVFAAEDVQEPVMRSYERDWREGLERWIEQKIRTALQTLPHPCERRVHRLRQRVEEIRERLDRVARKIEERQARSEREQRASEEDAGPAGGEQAKSVF